MQRNLEDARHFEHIDMGAGDVTRFDLGEKRLAAFGDDIAMPGRLHESNPLWLCETRMFGAALGLDCVLRHLKNRSFLNCEGRCPAPMARMTETTMTKTKARSKLGRHRQAA